MPGADPLCDQVLMTLRRIYQTIGQQSRQLEQTIDLTGPQLRIRQTEAGGQLLRLPAARSQTQLAEAFAALSEPEKRPILHALQRLAAPMSFRQTELAALPTEPVRVTEHLSAIPWDGEASEEQLYVWNHRRHPP